MKEERRGSMLVPGIIMGVLAFILFFIAYLRNEHLHGLRYSISLLLQMLPVFGFAIIIAGMVHTLVPHELVARWIGQEAGLRGIFIGSIAGLFTWGGPYIQYPIAAGLLQSKAGIGPIVAFLTGWGLYGLSRLPYEIGIIGWKFMIIRLACVFTLPFLAGLLAHLFFSKSYP
jgi:uncharacterized membrane protein YraQ (UPF0718 family)